MFLYKYLHPERVDVLKNLTIRYSQVSALNDPFELSPHLSGLASQEDLKSQIREELNRVIYQKYENLPFYQKIRIPYFSFYQEISKNFPDIIRLVDEPAQKFTAAVKDALSSMGDKLGMLCLSENPDSLLMWAHYADSHRGYVIKFNTNNDFFDQRISQGDLLRSLKKVKYKQDRPSSYVYDMSDIDFLLTKGEEWSYESEWRMFLPLEDADYNIKTEDDNIFLFKYPSEAIDSIIFGCKMNSKKKREIIDILKSEYKYKHIKIFQSNISGEKYSLNISDLENY